MTAKQDQDDGGPPESSLDTSEEPAATVDGARSVEALVSAVGSLPFLGAGATLLLWDESWWAAYALLLVGSSVVLVGLYLSVVSSQPQPDLVPDEQTLAVCRPSMMPPFARIVMSLALFVVAGTLYLWTLVPYVYPFAFFLAASYQYFRGAVRYWENRHTLYHLTNRRIVQKYCFASLRTTEIPVWEIGAVSVATSLAELATGRGSVIVARKDDAEGVRIHEIDNPGSVEQSLHRLMAESGARSSGVSVE